MKPIEVDSLLLAGHVFKAVLEAFAERGELRQTFIEHVRHAGTIEYELRVIKVNGKRVSPKDFKGAPRPNGRR